MLKVRLTEHLLCIEALLMFYFLIANPFNTTEGEFYSHFLYEKPEVRLSNLP